MNCTACMFRDRAERHKGKCDLCVGMRDAVYLKKYFIAAVSKDGFYPMISGFRSMDEAKILLGRMDSSGTDVCLLEWCADTMAYVMP